MSAGHESLLSSLGIDASMIEPPVDIWSSALAAAFDDSLPCDDATVPVMGDEPVVPGGGEVIIELDEPAADGGADEPGDAGLSDGLELDSAGPLDGDEPGAVPDLGPDLGFDDGAEVPGDDSDIL